MERDAMRKLIPLVMTLFFITNNTEALRLNKKSCSYYQKRFLDKKVKKNKNPDLQKILDKYYDERKASEQQAATCCGNIDGKDVLKVIITVITVGVPAAISIVSIIVPLLL